MSFATGDKIALMNASGMKFIGVVKICTVSQASYGDLGVGRDVGFDTQDGRPLNRTLRLVVNDLVMVKELDEFLGKKQLPPQSAGEDPTV